jgi:hypothetical protein
MDAVREENWFPIVLIALGGFLLLRNLGLIPAISWNVIWPLGLIALGIWVLTKGVQGPRKREIIVEGGRVITVEEQSPVMKLLAGIVVAFTLGLVGLIVLGVVAPLGILLIPLLPLILFFRLGAAFLKLLISFTLFGAPILLIILLLALLF